MLADKPVARTPHFALHIVPIAVAQKLSTAGAPPRDVSVDDLPVAAVAVPKRHARRAVTRAVLKRQMRAALACHAAALRGNACVVRLRAPFPATQFRSAASDPLRLAARRELDALFAAVR